MKNYNIYPIGSKVLIADNSSYYHQGILDGEKMEGTIIENTRDSILIYQIKWSNGSSNSYGESDIILSIPLTSNYEIY